DKTPKNIKAKEMGIEIHDVSGSTIGQGDVRGILRDGTAEGSAEVDFVGIDKRHYRATWSVRRARNMAEGNMQPDSITLKNITSHIDMPGKKVETYKEIERLVGLNFEQFTRSVLLAQGDFTAFMKANKDEKSSLLEKLTGTHIYSEISKKIYERYKIEELRLRDLNTRKEGINTLTEAELKTLDEERIDLANKINILEKQIEGLAKEITWYEQLAQFLTSRDDAEIALQKAIETKTNAAPRKQKLFRAEQAQKTRSWADALKHAQEQHAEKSRDLVNLKGHIAELHLQKEALEKQMLVSATDLTAKSRALDDALPLLARATKLDTLLSEKKEQLTKAREESENASAKNDQHQKTLNDKRAELNGLLTETKAIADWKAKNLDRGPIAENRDIVLSKLQDAHKLLETIRSSSRELEVLQEKIRAKETEKTGLEANLDNHLREWENLKKNCDTRSKALLLVPIETLQLDKAETDRTVQDNIQAQAHWQVFYSLQMDFEILERKQSKNRSEHDAKEKMLHHIDRQLINESAKKDTSAQLLQQARLAATENVEAL